MSDEQKRDRKETVVIRDVDSEVKQDLEAYKDEYGLNWYGILRELRDRLDQQGRLPDDN